MALAQIYGDPTKRLELYFRPKDPYCHPVCANRFSTSSLLLRVRRKTKRQEGLPGPEACPQVTFDVDILGIVPTVYRFQGNCRCSLTELGPLRAVSPCLQEPGGSATQVKGARSAQACGREVRAPSLQQRLPADLGRLLREPGGP